MTVINTTDNLLKESSCVFFSKFAMLNNVVKQLSTRHIFHHHEDVSGCADDLIQLDNVGVPKQLQILNFSSNFTNNVKILDFLPGNK